MPFLLFFTALCIGATFFIADVPPIVGLVLFIVANFAYQAALIYYDATLKTVSYPATRGKLSGMGTAIGYCGTVFVGLLIFFLDVPVADRFRLTAILFLVFAIPIFLVVREPKVADAKAGHGGRHPRRVRPAPSLDRARARGARSRPVPARAVLLFRRGQHGHRRHERRHHRGVRAVRPRHRPRPAVADPGGDRDELRVGLAVRPAGTEADARLGPPVMGGRAPRRWRSRSAFGPAGLSRSSSPARSWAAALAASRSPTGC